MTSLFLTNQLNKQLKNPLGVNFNFNIGIDNKSEDIVNTVSIGKQWSPNLKTSISRSFSESTTINYYKTEYQIKKNLFLVGTYEDTQPSSKSSHLRGNEDEEGELGLNLEYKLEFK